VSFDGASQAVQAQIILTQIKLNSTGLELNSKWGGRKICVHAQKTTLTMLMETKSRKTNCMMLEQKNLLNFN